MKINRSFNLTGRLAVLLLMIGLWAIAGCSRSIDTQKTLPLITDTASRGVPVKFPVTYFSDAAKVKAGEPSLEIVQALIQLVNGAEKGSDIYLNIYQIDYDPLISAIRQAADRDVRLHLIIDSSKESSLKKNSTAIENFRKIIKAPSELVLIDNDNGVNAINHHKHMLFSKVRVKGMVVNNVVFATSENFTQRELTVLEDAIVFSDAGLYDAFVENWNKMKDLALSGMKTFEFGRYRSQNGLVQAQFFPERTGGSWDGHYQIADFLDSLNGDFEKDTIFVGIDQWSDGQLAILDKLMALHDNGGHIEIITRNENSAGLGTKILSRLHALKDNGATVLILPDDQIIHSKYMMVNAMIGGQKRKVLLVGTLNYTNPATQHNNNLLLKLEDPAIFASYQANFKNIQKTYKKYE